MSGKYQIIYADPPWQYADAKPPQGACPYPTMRIDDICALPVKGLAAQNAALFMWCTWPFYEEGPKVMRAWGFEFKTVAFVWIKTNPTAPVNQYSFLPADSFDDRMGLGRWTRGNTEYCLLGTRGKPRRESADVRQIIYAPQDAHSRKPDETRQRIVRLMGDLPRVELFAREQAEGWDVWGNEVNSTVELRTEAA